MIIVCQVHWQTMIFLKFHFLLNTVMNSKKSSWAILMVCLSLMAYSCSKADTGKDDN